MPKATNISCYAAEEIKSLPHNTVMISINGEYGELERLQLDRNSSKILTVKFSDIVGNQNQENNGLMFHPIDGDTALKILDFINLNKEKDFIVHCHAGQSRSAAICLYLNISYGHELKKDFWKTSHPNEYVLGKLQTVRLRRTE